MIRKNYKNAIYQAIEFVWHASWRSKWTQATKIKHPNTEVGQIFINVDI